VRDDCAIEITPPADVAVPSPVLERRKSVERRAVEGNFVRVRADKLDELITLIGELVIAGAGTRLLAQRAGNSELIESTVSSEALWSRSATAR
jgi:two-component system chemotaxis sensor kinase CheA